jgi:hypothetical protein
VLEFFADYSDTLTPPCPKSIMGGCIDGFSGLAHKRPGPIK